MTSTKKLCPECGVSLKEANYEAHMKKVHKMDELKKPARRGLQGFDAFLVVGIIIAVSVLAYIMVGTNDNPGTGYVPDDGSTPNGSAPVNGDENGDNPRATIAIQGYSTPIVIELRPDRAPVTVDNFIKYANDGFFNGLIFHRVIEDFMIQGGGFQPGLTQKTPTYSPIINEASTSQMRNARGTIAMARTPDPDSATSQFFINHVDNGFLDWDNPDGDGYGYCVFGTVIQGMDIVDAIAGVATATINGMENVPVQDVIITSVTIS